jgi:hypothetical protein
MPALLPASLDKLEAHEIPAEYDAKAIAAFVAETKASEGAEISNTQKMFVDLCALLGVPAPKYKKAGGENDYCFEEDVKADKAHRRIDVYYRGHFVFEAKQGVNPRAQGDAIARAAAKAKTGHSKSARGAGVRGSADWLDAMEAGRTQAGNYALYVTQRDAPKPPFLLVADMGHRFWVWSSFQPDARDDYGDFERDDAAAFTWDDLAQPEVFALLRTIWTAPQELDEEAIGQRVTAEIAAKVCDLAVRLEKRAKPQEVGDFLMKCVFTMFAEDVNLIPTGLFSKRLDGWISDVKAGKKGTFVKGLRRLWTVMNEGGDLDSGDTIKRFNGYLFKTPEPLDLALDELEALRVAARADWRRVSPAIFGTLLERALTPEERHKLGAHYTPEAYIRRLVERTLMEPLRAEWSRVRVEMDVIRRTGAKVKDDGTVTSTAKPLKDYDPAKARAAALEHGHRFRRRLAAVRILDPACGSGNFLYVAMKEMKRIEGEVERALLALSPKQNRWLDIDGESVRPVQFWGVELKPRAAKVAELVLWIGYLQWQVSAGRLARMREPLIQELHHIENRDALVTWKRREPLLDDDGEPVLRATGVTDKKAERKMVPVERYVGVKAAEWPEADFVVGNPPFLGNKRMNDVLGAGYVEAIKRAFPDVKGGADLVMWWWWRAADLAAKGKVRRFGFVTTNSITQTASRAVVEEALEGEGVRLVYAIPDHPWYDEGAAVRIAMTVGATEKVTPVLGTVVDESQTQAAQLELVRVEEEQVPVIHAHLKTGARVAATVPLQSNVSLAFMGMTLLGDGFRLEPEQFATLGFDARSRPSVVRPYVTGRDLSQGGDARFVIDMFGLSADDARRSYPKLYNHLVKTVKPIRDKQNESAPRERWWLFGRTRPELRDAMRGLKRFIVTLETSKHRFFQFLSAAVVPDHSLFVVASDDGFVLGVLSSRVHLAWSAAMGGTLEDRPRWRSQTCFDPFPFPDAKAAQRAKIAKLGEAIDAHREARQKADPELALTDVYNVLAKLRAGAALTDNDESVRERAMVDTLRDLHDDLDRAVFEAYGWPATLTDDEILTHLVELNAKRAQEEAKGKVRYLRPDFQAGLPVAPTKAPEVPAKAAKPTRSAKVDATKWPTDVFERVGAVVRALQGRDEAVGAEVVAATFTGATVDEVVMALRNAAAAQLVARIVTDDGEAWIARA